MNKTKTILAATGGVIGIAVLVMAYFSWSAFSAKTVAIEGDEEEGTDGLETVMGKAERLSRLTPSHPVYPSAQSLKAIESNRTAVVDWQQEATALATRGDRAFPKTTPAAFKTFIVADAKRLAELPGSVAGVLVKPEFAFGPFREYIVEGKMPAEAQLVELQRRWDDVATVVELLAKSGVAELTDVQFAAKSDKEASADAEGKRGRAAPRDGRRAANVVEKAPAAYSYVFSFATKPAGLTKVLNELVVCERFVSVDGFTFSRPKDALSSALGGEDKKKDVVQGSGRRGRRRAAAVDQDKKADEQKGDLSGIVTDPLLDEPISVVLTATVSDFRSLEEDADGAASAEKKGASK